MNQDDSIHPCSSYEIHRRAIIAAGHRDPGPEPPYVTGPGTAPRGPSMGSRNADRVPDIPVCAEVRPLYCNTGGPRSRTRTEDVKLTLLGDERRHGYWSCREVVGIRFPNGVAPRQWCLQQLERRGYTRAEDMLERVTIPRRVLHVHSVTFPHLGSSPLLPGKDMLDDVLRAALILGKCTDDIYDPDRPSIWTNRNLVRAVALYSPGDFYAE